MDLAPENDNRSNRYPPRGTSRASCFKGAMGLGANLALGIQDLGEEEVCLLLSEVLPVGLEVLVELECIQHQRPLKLPGKVVLVQADANGRALTDIHFEKPLPYRDLQALAQID